MGFPAEASGLLVSGGLDGEPGRPRGRPATRGGVRRARGSAQRRRPAPDGPVRVARDAQLDQEGGGAARPGQRGAAPRARRRATTASTCAALRDAIATDRAAGLHPVLRRGHRGHGEHGRHRRPARHSRTSARRRGSGSTWTAPSARWPRSPPTCDRGSAGIERADSLAFDLAQVGLPSDRGGLRARARTPKAHRAAFADHRRLPGRGRGRASPAARTASRDLGVQLSRGFKALKVWMGLKAHGTDKLGRLIQQNVEQAALPRRARRARRPSWSCWPPSRSTSSASATAATAGRRRPRPAQQARSWCACTRAAWPRPSVHGARRALRAARLHHQPPHAAARTSTSWCARWCACGQELSA